MVFLIIEIADSEIMRTQKKGEARIESGYADSRRTACAAASRAIGTLGPEQET